MNLLGKILIVLIVLMSVLFMGLAMAVYSSHQNWYLQAQDLNTQLGQTRVALQQANDGANRLESRLNGDLEALRQQVGKLSSERTLLADQNTALLADLDQLRQQSSERIAAVAATQQNNDRLVEEISNQRDMIRDNQQARDRNFATMLAATEARDQTEGRREILQQQNRGLTTENARMTKLLRSQGVHPGTDPEFVMEPTDGVVTAVRRRGATQLIEVTIGSDDGLRSGHTVEVYRGGRYLGRATITETAPDRAVGEVDRRFLQGQIQEGDRVATRLKLS